MGSPFDITLAITNTSVSEMRLQLLAPLGEGGLLIDGLCMRHLGTLKPNTILPLTLRMLPIEPGLQKLSGMQLVDTLTEQAHELGTLAEVFIHNAPTADRPLVEWLQ